jgi:hypothetical protein
MHSHAAAPAASSLYAATRDASLGKSRDDGPHLGQRNPHRPVAGTGAFDALNGLPLNLAPIETNIL